MDARKNPLFVKDYAAQSATPARAVSDMHNTKQQAIAGLARSLDVSFFKAIAEPVRQEIIFILLLQGRSNVQQVAQNMVQDRSVVSRHLAFLEQAGFLRSFKVQRYTVYELDGPAIICRLENVLQQLRTAAMVCCPSPNSAAAASPPDGPTHD